MPFWPYFWDRTQVTRDFASASVTLLGGIGIWPQTPLPPAFTLADSVATAPPSPLYLAATSLKAGPTSFLSTAWQDRQFFALARASSACAPEVTARPRVAAS